MSSKDNEVIEKFAKNVQKAQDLYSMGKAEEIITSSIKIYRGIKSQYICEPFIPSAMRAESIKYMENQIQKWIYDKNEITNNNFGDKIFSIDYGKYRKNVPYGVGGNLYSDDVKPHHPLFLTVDKEHQRSFDLEN